MSGRKLDRNEGRTAVLLAFGPDELLTIGAVRERTGLAGEKAKAALNKARLCYDIENTGQYVGSAALHRLTEQGKVKRAKLAFDAAVDEHAADTSVELTDLAEKAFSLIALSATGMDSAALAEALGSTNKAVQAALQPKLDAGALVSCGLTRPKDGVMLRLMIYRKSAIDPVRRLSEGREFGTAVRAELKGADEAEHRRRVRDVSAPAPASASAPEPAPAPAPAPAARGPKAAPTAATKRDNFWCALDSAGELSIQSGHAHIALEPAHAQRLRAYLARVSA